MPLFFYPQVIQAGHSQMLLSAFLDSELVARPFVCVLGYPVSHSRSPAIHNAALAYHGIHVQYYAVACPPEEFHLVPALFKMPEFKGANVTIPLKEKIVSLLDSLETDAKRIGAVNTVVPDGRDRRLKGYNTDVYGFMKPLEPFGEISAATILGTGGAARAAIAGLAESGCKKIHLVSRTSKKHEMAGIYSDIVRVITYDDLEQVLPGSQLLVNTTPVGMHPGRDSSPVGEELIPLLKRKICYDIIYNPPETKLVRQARREGAKVIGGLDMFLYQAARSFELWFGKTMPMDLVRDVVIKSLDEMNMTASG